MILARAHWQALVTTRLSHESRWSHHVMMIRRAGAAVVGQARAVEVLAAPC